MMPKSPTPATVSRLYCLSGNRCAFPDCTTSLVQEPGNVLVGEVCHIEGDKPGSARHNASQTDAERHGFANLIIMCSNHHKVIDTDRKTWTVAALVKLKADHEAAATPVEEPDLDLVQQLLATVVVVNVDQITNGSVIPTINQSGGQVAHQIVNQGMPQRTLTPKQVDDLVQILGRLPAQEFSVTAPDGHSEAYRFGEVLYSALLRAGWMSKCHGLAKWIGEIVPPGVHMIAEHASVQFLAIVEWMRAAQVDGTAQYGKRPPVFPGSIEILIGPAVEK